MRWNDHGSETIWDGLKMALKVLVKMMFTRRCDSITKYDVAILFV